jgi:CPA2 family monovalent cation:H+ antiporter-2
MHHNNILFELGIVLFIGFFAAVLMKKFRQSVITGYMIVGLLIGPNVFAWIKDTSLLSSLAELGIVFLMFFLGLEFSIKKFRKVQNSVLFIGTYKTIFSLIFGFILGSVIGFLFKEKLFLAAIITISSSVVLAKILFDSKQTASKEAEVLMGVTLFEDFVAIIILGVLSSLTVSNKVDINSIFMSLFKTVLFFSTFIGLGILIANRFTDKILMRIESQELFTALMIGGILIIGSTAHKIGIDPAASAFLVGMLINSYDVEERIHRTVSAFKDIFLIVFFIYFGMLLDPRQIIKILWMVVIVVPLSILAEIILTSSAAFLCGFSSRNAVKMSTGAIARGEYNMLFASLGFSSGVISADLYQFTGVYVFLMALVAPVAFKNSHLIKSVLVRPIPNFIKYTARLISASMRPLLLPEEIGIKTEQSFKYMLTFFGYIGIVFSLFILHNIYIIIPLTLVGLYVVLRLRKMFRLKIQRVEQQIDFFQIHQGFYDLDTIIRSIANLFSALLAIIVCGAAFWNFGHIILIILLLSFIFYSLITSLVVYTKSKRWETS